MVRCTVHRHCHHCHYHYEKCRCRIHLLCCLRSNRHPILYHLATCILQQVLRTVVSVMFVIVMIVMVMVLLRYMRDSASSVLFVLQVYKLIWKLLPIEPKRPKFTVRITGSSWSARVNLRKLAVCEMLVLVTLKIPSPDVLFCTFRIRQNWLSCLRF